MGSLITRYGAGKVEDMLPTHIETVKATGVPVVWQCDAVHGNGIVAKSNGLKTRHMDDIVAEIVQCIKVHRRCGSILGGIHVEATGQENVQSASVEASASPRTCCASTTRPPATHASI